MESKVTSRLKIVGATDVGLARSVNEDSLLVEEDLGLLLVADGVGGHGAGDVASSTAVEAICDYLYEFDPELQGPDGPDGPDGDETTMDFVPTIDDEEDDVTPVDDTINRALNGHPPSRDGLLAGVVRSALRTANEKIHDLNVERGRSEGGGMGTTIVGLWFAEDNGRVIIFHVGDSRIYRFRNGRLFQLTRDHSLYQEWLDAGGHGQPPRKNIISRALGPWPDVTPDVGLEYLEPGDLYLLCSDGLCGVIKDEAIATTLAGEPDLDAASKSLITQVKANGAPDNVTLVLARWA